MARQSRTELYAAIRRDVRVGLSIRWVMRKCGVWHLTVREVLDSVWPKPRKKTEPRAMLLDLFKPVTSSWYGSCWAGSATPVPELSREFPRLGDRFRPFWGIRIPAPVFSVVRMDHATGSNEMTATPGSGPPGRGPLHASRRVWAGWRAAHRPVDGVPRWARVAALVATLTVLPSCIWRILGSTFRVPIVDVAQPSGRTLGMPDGLYVVVLSVFSELVAFTAYGLIARWGEAWPRWMLGLRGRRIPVPAAAVPAAVGSLVLTVLWSVALAGVFTDTTLQGRPAPADFPLHFHSVRGVLAVLAYLPLVLWGPLLGALTVHYVRRRSQRAPAPR